MSKPPNRLVPTLTEVVLPRQFEAAETSLTAPIATPSGSVPKPDAELVDRIVRRVDALLEQRLRETVNAVMVEQALQMTPLLQNELGAMVHKLVVQALADEWGGTQRAKRTG